MSKISKQKTKLQKNDYTLLVGDISQLLETARKESARTVNALLTATYWLVGYRIVEFEYQGRELVEYYGDGLITKLAKDLTNRFGRGFGKSNIYLMKTFYMAYKNIFQTLSGKSQAEDLIRQSLSDESFSDKNIIQTPSGKSLLTEIANNFQLPWSTYVRLLSVKDDKAREFYETEALRNGWSVRQLDRQISTQFYERTLLSKNKSQMLKHSKTHEDTITAEEEIKDPFILEFLGLKDEYSESDLEELLIQHLENFLLELGSDFAFIGRQKRLTGIMQSS